MVSIYFLDSSALVKRYIAETGSNWIRSVTALDSHNPLIITRITWVEVLSAFTRRQREGNLTSDNVTLAIQTFRYDMDTQYQVAELDKALTEYAGQLVLRHPLRAYDAVQLAAALQVQAELKQFYSTTLTFLVADDRLLAIAQAEGLHTDNPNHHL